MSGSNLAAATQGEAFGRALIAAQALRGRVCFFETSRYRGLARIERVDCHAGHFVMDAITLHQLPGVTRLPPLPGRVLQVEGAMPFGVDGLRLTFGGRAEAIDAFRAPTFGGGGGVVVHHPLAVAAIVDICQTGSSQQVIDAIDSGQGLAPEIPAFARLPFQADGLAMPAQPQLQLIGDGGARLLRLDGLPPPGCPVLAWPLRDPTQVLIEVCHAVLAGPRPPGAKAVQIDLMAALVACDRRHRWMHSAAVPALEVTPQLLYAHWPDLAGFFHFQVHGVWVNHDLQEPDLVRLLRDIAGLVGWTFATG